MCTYSQKILTAFRNRIIDRPTVCFFSTTKPGDLRIPEDFTITFPEITELRAALDSFPGIKRQFELYAHRFDNGDRVCVVRCGENLAHVSWFGIRTELEADYELGPNHPWPLKHPSGLIYDCWTAHQQRGRGLYPATVSLLTLKLLHEAPEVWIYCRTENTASRRGIEKAGFYYRGCIRSWRVLGSFY